MPAAPQSNSTVIHKLADCVSLRCMVVNKTTLAVFFATRHPFFSSCSISRLVHRPASRECPYPRIAGKVNALCDRTTFFIQPPYTFWSHSYKHSGTNTHQFCFLYHFVSSKPSFVYVSFEFLSFLEDLSCTIDWFWVWVWRITHSCVHWSLHAWIV